MHWSIEETYVGQWKEGKRHGVGTQKWKAGDVLEPLTFETVNELYAYTSETLMEESNIEDPETDLTVDRFIEKYYKTTSD
jgi:hypothetical protein